MTPPPGKPSNFAEGISSAQTSPADAVGKDRYDGYPMPPGADIRDGEDEVSNRGIPSNVNPATGYTNHQSTMRREVFLIYRPYNDCHRCMTLIKGGGMNLPEKGDYVCPHTRLAQYEEVLNGVLNGSYALQNEAETTLKDGTIVVSVQWTIPNPVLAKRSKRWRGPPPNQKKS